MQKRMAFLILVFLPALTAGSAACSESCCNGPPKGGPLEKEDQAASTIPPDGSTDTRCPRLETVEGRFETQRISNGKGPRPIYSSHIVSIQDDRRGQRLIALLLKPEYFPFVDKRVIATGCFRHDPTQRQVPFWTMKSIKLAPGETPYRPAPTQLPAPPWVGSAEDLGLRNGRWVSLVAKVVAVTRAKQHGSRLMIGRATLLLGDGTMVWVERASPAHWAHLIVGRKVTVIGLMELSKKDGLTVALFDSYVSICPGRMERCGMDLPGRFHDSE